ncbi:MAG: N-6 DNA methylase [Alphaproteobacteria bacterium]|nr:N-6 DNA methylase [Alphaproteobacteria bacterium]
MPPSAAKRLGATPTPPDLAADLARRMLDLIEISEDLSVLDPAVGRGELLLAIVAALGDRAPAGLTLWGWDEDAAALEVAERRLRAAAPRARLELRRGSFLEALDASPSPGPFDAIIANPPWVRTQVLGAARSQALAARYGLQGKVDLAWAFLVCLPELLRPGGVAGVLTPNRLLSTRSAARVRARLREALALRGLWDLGDTKLFDAAVLPAMLLLQAAPPSRAPFVSAYETDAPATGAAETVVQALETDGVVALPDGRHLELRRGWLSAAGEDGVWRLSRPEDEAWLAQVQAHTWRPLSALGEPRVGVKSTADRVFIREAWGEVEEALLRPLLTHHVARRYRAQPPTRRILYPHERRDGARAPVELAAYPGARAWLEAHRERLSARGYLEEAGRRWYELWVPHDPEGWAAPKLVWRDISPTPQFWVDTSGAVVNGDCYWLRPSPELDEGLLWLALATCNSALAARLYDLRFNNRLYAGRRRYLSQYVRRFPLPDPTHPAARRAAEGARAAWARGGADEALHAQISADVARAFGLSPD